MKTKNGFTLIELLVVIAVIALLLAVLIPSLQTAKQMAQGIVCLANLRGIANAYYLYAEDNDGKLVRAGVNPAWDGVNNNAQPPRNSWVHAPHNGDPNPATRVYTNHSSTVPEKENGITTGLLFLYTETPKVYHCPGDRRYRVDVNSGKGAYRSYSIPAGANGGWPDTVTISGMTLHPIRKYSDFISPGSKYVFVEENYTHSPGTFGTTPMNVGYNGNDWSFWHGDDYRAFWDPLAPWHNDRTNLGFADGHGEKLVWRNEKTMWFAHDRMDPRLGNSTAECRLNAGIDNVDQQYMSRAYPCIRN